jgi:hypothetical protein
MKSITALILAAVTSTQELPTIDDADFTMSKYANKIDHFNYQDNRTYQQRYWVNDKYWTSEDEDGPFFLYLCGEWRCDVPSSKYPFMLGASYGAKLLVLEHRYYGDSQPFTDWSLESL